MKPLSIGLCLLFLTTAAKLKAQEETTWTPSKQYSQSQLIADLELLKTVLTEAHPSIYRYQPKATADSSFKKALAKVNGPMTVAEFWKVIQPIIVGIHSAHTDIYPSADEAAWYNKHPADFMPPLFYVDGNKIFMVTHKRDTIAKIVRLVKSINGISAEFVLDTLKSYIVGEGLGTQFVNFQLQAGRFSRIYGQVYGYKPEYKVIVTDSSGEDKELKLKARATKYGNSADKFKQMLQSKKNELNEVVAVNYPSDLPSTAVLKIKSFTYFNYYQNFHENFFKRIKSDKITNLVIDIRGNPGGFSDIGLDLLKYLITKSMCIQMEKMQIPLNKVTFNANVLAASSDKIPVLYRYRDTSGNYDEIRFNKVFCAPFYNFKKNLYLLTDRATFSAAAMFAAALKSQRQVTIVGEETGGGEAGTDGGWFSIVKLPNTGLLLRLPRYHITNVAPHPNAVHGLAPDFTINTPLDADTDVVMKKVKDLILGAGTN